ncbi:hypothetical protein ACRE_082360 [Hapsidospora chrysogenum ATCC 11550]|uniref:Helix-turn-helix domain-containing protein n=1 Tax=Hapsidospora chrysogenum (strain ATCC 11550 / CBS 779.69 / DSM 880 / IAM 14645 / JCM 23072 / IMI 49137) TaxID=857340 RepID=A0A086SVC0_HAPC1|nr:hypothetical protein ACRE_082360 [Hapsidospora chrysogenum ATCC 11550]
MGSASSKAARGAPRKYPTMPSHVTSGSVANKAKANAQPTARHTNEKSDDIRADSMDPDAVTGNFSQRLQQMGVVQPNPTYSPSSTAMPHQNPAALGRRSGSAGPAFAPTRSNPTLSALEARRRLQQEAEAEFEALGTGKPGGRRFVDMRTLVDAMTLLNRGTPQEEIEKRLNLENGLLERLGKPGTLSHESTSN